MLIWIKLCVAKALLETSFGQLTLQWLLQPTWRSKHDHEPLFKTNSLWDFSVISLHWYMDLSDSSKSLPSLVGVSWVKCGRSLQEQHKGSLGKETQFLVFLVLCLTFLLSSLANSCYKKTPPADDPEDFPKGNNIYSAQFSPGIRLLEEILHQWRHLKNPVKRLGYSPYQSYQLFNCFSDFFHQQHPHHQRETCPANLFTEEISRFTSRLSRS